MEKLKKYQIAIISNFQCNFGFALIFSNVAKLHSIQMVKEKWNV